MSKWIIFYSWQSDLPKDTNYKTIRIGLKNASAKIESELDNVQIELDEATRDTPGSPNIPETIFQKITSADIFIADISTINFDYSQRKVPNPNVLIELGYAISYLGWSRIILVFNKSFGNFPADIPFDIDRHRIIDYQVNDKNDTNGKTNLQNELKTGIKKIIELNPIKSFEKISLSPEEIKHRKDINNLTLAFSNIHMATMDDFIEHIPDRIIGSIFYFWEGFKATFISSEFHLYDEKANELIQNLVKHWGNTLSYSHRYHPGRGDIYIFTSEMDIFTKDQQKDYDILQEERKKLFYSYHNLIDYIRKQYIEIDLEITSKSAIDEYISFHKEFMEQLNKK